MVIAQPMNMLAPNGAIDAGSRKTPAPMIRPITIAMLITGPS